MKKNTRLIYKDELRKEGEKTIITYLEISFIIYKNTKVGPVNSKKYI
ncbi:MAG TPA: hypothetical protein VEW92_04100 [Nitrososphaeraceae archaeon]|nr:hypothetical protein [Nitrososphaeraceae archaeon]